MRGFRLGFGLQGVVAGSSAPSYPFDVFADSSRADDSGNGLTSATAKKTIAAAAALLTTGKRLGLAKGSHWREQLTITASGVSVGAFGTGAAPILNGSDIVLNANFTKTAAQTNPYDFSVTHSLASSVANSFSVFENGTRLKRVASLALCNSTAGSFFAPTIAAGTQTISVHPTGSTNPTSDGKTYEVSIRDFALESTGANTTVEGITVKRCVQNDGVIAVHANGAILRTITVSDGQKHNVYVGDGSLVEDVVSTAQEGFDSAFISFANSGTGTIGSTFRRCYAYGVRAFGETAAYRSGGSGFYAHCGSGHYPVMTFEDCYVEDYPGGLGADADTVNIIRCSTKNVSGPIYSFPGSGRVTNLTKCFFDGRGTATFQKANNLIQCNQGTTNIDGCVVVLNPSAYNFALRNVSDNGSIINVSYSTFVNQNAAQGQAFLYKNGTGLVTLDHNIISEFGDAMLADDADMTVAASNNVWHRTSGAIAFKNAGTAYANFAAWQASGQDTAGLSVNPSFTNAVSTWDDITDAAPSAASVVSLQAGATYYPL